MNYNNMLTLKNRLSLYDAGYLLDVGTGRGEFLQFALRSFHSWKTATALDTDAESLSTASKEMKDLPIVLIQASALSMPFLSGYFDMITLSNVLHHIENIPGLLLEVSRVGKTGGILIINEMLNENISELQESYLLYHKLTSELDNNLGFFHRDTYTLKEMLMLLKPLNLQLLEYFIHAEEAENFMNASEIEEISDRLRKKVARLKGSDYYYFYENKSREIINRFLKTGIHRPRHATFILQIS
jgi:ubiquinone/menaquinone biosynthesis C-methylase UbiE